MILFCKVVCTKPSAPTLLHHSTTVDRFIQMRHLFTDILQIQTDTVNKLQFPMHRQCNNPTTLSIVSPLCPSRLMISKKINLHFVFCYSHDILFEAGYSDELPACCLYSSCYLHNEMFAYFVITCCHPGGCSLRSIIWYMPLQEFVTWVVCMSHKYKNWP